MAESEAGMRGIRLAFGLSLAIGLGLGAHALWRMTSGAAGAQDPVADWMTPAHLVNALGMPADRIAQVLGVTGALPSAPLRDLAAERGLSSAALISDLLTGAP